jgi:hypothetical protein
VRLNQFKTMDAALRDIGQPAETFLAAGEGHGSRNPTTSPNCIAAWRSSWTNTSVRARSDGRRSNASRSSQRKKGGPMAALFFRLSAGDQSNSAFQCVRIHAATWLTLAVVLPAPRHPDQRGEHARTAASRTIAARQWRTATCPPTDCRSSCERGLQQGSGSSLARAARVRRLHAKVIRPCNALAHLQLQRIDAIVRARRSGA